MAKNATRLSIQPNIRNFQNVISVLVMCTFVTNIFKQKK